MDPNWELNRFLRQAFWHEMNVRCTYRARYTYRFETTYLLW